MPDQMNLTQNENGTDYLNMTFYLSENYSGTHNISNEYYIFDKIYIRVIFISLYTIVFCLCFFGNLLVILVVTLSRRLRSITNFFLANLAVADFFVAIFCVYQNLFIYIVESVPESNSTYTSTNPEYTRQKVTKPRHKIWDCFTEIKKEKFQI